MESGRPADFIGHAFVPINGTSKREAPRLSRGGFSLGHPAGDRTGIFQECLEGWREHGIASFERVLRELTLQAARVPLDRGVGEIGSSASGMIVDGHDKLSCS